MTGLLLGLVGGGGSLLAVPFLGLLGLGAHEAKAGALLVVAGAALAGLWPHLRAGSIDGRAALLVGGAGASTSLLVAVLARGLSDTAQSLLFAGVAGTAGWGLLRRGARDGDDTGEAVPERDVRAGKSLVVGLAAGSLTGLVGVGGGFVVVPALAYLGLSPRRAVGTSLVIVAANALAGLAGHWLAPTRTVLSFLLGAIVGALGGAALAGRLPQPMLRRILGAILGAVALAMVARVVLQVRVAR